MLAVGPRALTHVLTKAIAEVQRIGKTHFEGDPPNRLIGKSQQLSGPQDALLLLEGQGRYFHLSLE